MKHNRIINIGIVLVFGLLLIGCNQKKNKDNVEIIAKESQVFNKIQQDSTSHNNELPMVVPVVNSSWWQIANENFDAGIYSNKPGFGEPTLRKHQQVSDFTEPTLRKHQQVSDFTIYKDANGKWQLISAVRATKFPKGKHFLMRWEADKFQNEKIE